MNKLLSLTIALWIMTGFCCFAQTQQMPNIVIFFIDDMGSQDLGCYGNNFYQTPSIDKLANNGVRFTNAYSACTVCSPTRASLMTGKYPARLQITDWIQGHKKPYAKLNVPNWTMYLPLQEKTLAESLKEKGYATWHVGKWHLGDDEMYWPDQQGFDVNIAGNFKGAPIKNKQYNGFFSPYGLKRLNDGPKDEYLTDRLTEEAINLIDRQNSSQPFFLNLAHYAVHTPIQGKADKVEKYKQLLNGEKHPQKNPVYAAMIESVDESVARIIQKLEEKKLLENTFIVFMADNGSLASVSTSPPFRKGKGWAYEGGTRTPLLMYWKGKIEGGKLIDEPVITMDIYTTIMQLVKAKLPNNVDGKNLLPVITENKTYNRPLFWHYPHYHNDKPHGAVRLGDWKLIEYFEDNHFELYNLKEDIGEANDLSKQNIAKAEELKKLMVAWRKKVNAQMMTTNPNYDAAKANKGPQED
ncbi:sulfatase [Lacibacter sp.]|uniref:sulfatase n=1 Tax=Lacibacter sp. TaxID=1915409 RepID=UPI002B4ACE75|nr:sulfatase [Lacibacter sp.]HLP37701.1 sulfatase [Lacibacter sp.]